MSALTEKLYGLLKAIDDFEAALHGVRRETTKAREKFEAEARASGEAHIESLRARLTAIGVEKDLVDYECAVFRQATNRFRMTGGIYAATCYHTTKGCGPGEVMWKGCWPIAI
jgi:hypothetical protein